MTEAAKKVKVTRKNKLGSFTRIKNRLQTLLDGGTVDHTLLDVYEELATAFKTLEEAHEALCLVLEEDDPEADGTYLDGPSDLLSQMQQKNFKSSFFHSLS